MNCVDDEWLDFGGKGCDMWAPQISLKRGKNALATNISEYNY